MKRNYLDLSAQIFIPFLTIAGQIVLSLKFPQWALFLMLASEPFWLYSSWKAYKKAGQIGIFINTIIITVVIIIGIINYWFL
jgi:hypothetical protein